MSGACGETTPVKRGPGKESEDCSPKKKTRTPRKVRSLNVAQLRDSGIEEGPAEKLTVFRLNTFKVSERSALAIIGLSKKKDGEGYEEGASLVMGFEGDVDSAVLRPLQDVLPGQVFSATGLKSSSASKWYPRSYQTNGTLRLTKKSLVTLHPSEESGDWATGFRPDLSREDFTSITTRFSLQEAKLPFSIKATVTGISFRPGTYPLLKLQLIDTVTKASTALSVWQQTFRWVGAAVAVGCSVVVLACRKGKVYQGSFSPELCTFGCILVEPKEVSWEDLWDGDDASAPNLTLDAVYKSLGSERMKVATVSVYLSTLSGDNLFDLDNFTLIAGCCGTFSKSGGAATGCHCPEKSISYSYDPMVRFESACGTEGAEGEVGDVSGIVPSLVFSNLLTAFAEDGEEDEPCPVASLVDLHSLLRSQGESEWGGIDLIWIEEDAMKKEDVTKKIASLRQLFFTTELTLTGAFFMSGKFRNVTVANISFA